MVLIDDIEVGSNACVLMQLLTEQGKANVGNYIRDSYVRLMRLRQPTNATNLSAAKDSILCVRCTQRLRVHGRGSFFEQVEVVDGVVQSMTMFLERSLTSQLKHQIELYKAGSSETRLIPKAVFCNEKRVELLRYKFSILPCGSFWFGTHPKCFLYRE